MVSGVSVPLTNGTVYVMLASKLGFSMQGLYPLKLAYFPTEWYTKGIFSSGSNSRQVKLSHETTDALCHFVSVVIYKTSCILGFHVHKLYLRFEKQSIEICLCNNCMQ